MSRQTDAILAYCNADPSTKFWVKYFTKPLAIKNEKLGKKANDQISMVFDSISKDTFALNDVKTAIQNCTNKVELITALSTLYNFSEQIPVPNLELIRLSVEPEYDNLPPKAKKSIVTLNMRTMINISSDFEQVIADTANGRANQRANPLLWRYLPFLFKYFNKVPEKHYKKYHVILEEVIRVCSQNINAVTSPRIITPLIGFYSDILDPLIVSLPLEYKLGRNCCLNFLTKFFTQCVKFSYDIKQYIGLISKFFQFINMNRNDTLVTKEVIICCTEYLNYLFCQKHAVNQKEYYDIGILCSTIFLTSKSDLYNRITFPLHFYAWIIENNHFDSLEFEYVDPVQQQPLRSVASFTILPFESYRSTMKLPSSSEFPSIFKVDRLQSIVDHMQMLGLKANESQEALLLLYTFFAGLVDTYQSYPEHQILILLFTKLYSGVTPSQLLADTLTGQIRFLFDDLIFSTNLDTIPINKPAHQFIQQTRSQICIFAKAMLCKQREIYLPILNAISFATMSRCDQFYDSFIPFLNSVSFDLQCRFKENIQVFDIAEHILSYIYERWNTKNGIDMFNYFQVLVLFSPYTLFNSPALASVFYYLILNPVFTHCILDLYQKGIEICLTNEREESDVTLCTILLIFCNTTQVIIGANTRFELTLEILHIMTNVVEKSKPKIISNVINQSVLLKLLHIPMRLFTPESLITLIEFLLVAFKKCPGLMSIEAGEFWRIIIDLSLNIQMNLPLVNSFISFMFLENWSELNEIKVIKNWSGIKLFLLGTQNSPFKNDILVYFNNLLRASLMNCVAASRDGTMDILLQLLDTAQDKSFIFEMAKYLLDRYPSPNILAGLFGYIRRHLFVTNSQELDFFIDYIIRHSSVKTTSNVPLSFVFITETLTNNELVPGIHPSVRFETSIQIDDNMVYNNVYMIIALTAKDKTQLSLHLINNRFEFHVTHKGKNLVVNTSLTIQPSQWYNVIVSFTESTAIIEIKGGQTQEVQLQFPNTNDKTTVSYGSPGLYMSNTYLFADNSILSRLNINESPFQVKSYPSFHSIFEEEGVWGRFFSIFDAFQNRTRENAPTSLLETFIQVTLQLLESNPVKINFANDRGYHSLAKELKTVERSQISQNLFNQLINLYNRDKSDMALEAIILNPPLWDGVDFTVVKQLAEKLPKLYEENPIPFINTIETNSYLADFCLFVKNLHYSQEENDQIANLIWKFISKLLKSTRNENIYFTFINILSASISPIFDFLSVQYMYELIDIKDSSFLEALSRLSYFTIFSLLFQKSTFEVKRLCLDCMVKLSPIANNSESLMDSIIGMVGCPIKSADDASELTKFVLQNLSFEFLPLISYLTTFLPKAEAKSIWEKIKSSEIQFGNCTYFTFWIYLLCHSAFEGNDATQEFIEYFDKFLNEKSVRTLASAFHGFHHMSNAMNRDFTELKIKIIRRAFSMWPESLHNQLLALSFSTLFFRVHVKNDKGSNAMIDSRVLISGDLKRTSFEMRLSPQGEWLDKDFALLVAGKMLTVVKAKPETLIYFKNGRFINMTLAFFYIEACLIKTRVVDSKPVLDDIVNLCAKADAFWIHRGASFIMKAGRGMINEKCNEYLTIMEKYELYHEHGDSIDLQTFLFEEYLNRHITSFLNMDENYEPEELI